ncbi:Carboxylic ester hydrolase [Fusarium falciforme]|uniref:Carboxylic ester hydrolase n=1 Tax=Fusarium falciforme TaxID=195108 RepID=UPI0023006534|nr:Carboxylic ester hydrolase [Fusarium falciforme]WAO91202.1 Carboxylic ester hydrolase [Fusarium falciforme]
MTDSFVTLQTSSSTVQGVQDERFGRPVWHFRGIPYGRIPKRFHKPEYDALPRELDATKFGPQCPQPKVDVGHLLRLPRNVESPTIEEDEFNCLNLNISRPSSADIKDKGLFPVLVWIHGGSQCVTFASAASPVCDPTRFVAESVDNDKPIIVVTFNYRLNIFAFGDGVGERNLALQDQKLALQWVSDNIQDFGGDPKKITLAGESAGAVYVHAHVLSKTAPKSVYQAILASGSLHLSPPQPLEVGQGLLKRIKTELQARGDTMHDGSADSLVQALINCGVTSMWLQEEPDLDDWENRTENIDGIIISDVEYESAIWRSGVDLLKTEEIVEIIRDCSQDAPKLKELYHIYPERPVSSRLGVLDLINDTRFALPALEISERWRRNNKRVYQYIVDEANPWQASSRAHHAVDLIFLFGGIDLSFNPGADRVGKEMRQAWMTFMYGGSPWPESSIQAYGPYGNVEELDVQKYKARRRVHCFDYLRTMGTAQCRLLSGRLGAGRVSLLN